MNSEDVVAEEYMDCMLLHNQLQKIRRNSKCMIEKYHMLIPSQNEVIPANVTFR